MSGNGAQGALRVSAPGAFPSRAAARCAEAETWRVGNGERSAPGGTGVAAGAHTQTRSAQIEAARSTDEPPNKSLMPTRVSLLLIVNLNHHQVVCARHTSGVRLLTLNSRHEHKT